MAVRMKMVESGDYVLLSRDALEKMVRTLPVVDWKMMSAGEREAQPLEANFFNSLIPDLRRVGVRNLGGEAMMAEPRSFLDREVVLVSADLLRDGHLDLNEAALAKCVFVSRSFFFSPPDSAFKVSGAVPFVRLHTTHSEALQACLVNAGAGPSDQANVLDLVDRQV